MAREFRRALAALSAAFQEFAGTESEALDYVVSANVERRHLNESQRELIAADIDRGNQYTGAKLSLDSLAEKSTAEAAKQLNVGVVERAKALKRNIRPLSAFKGSMRCASPSAQAKPARPYWW